MVENAYDVSTDYDRLDLPRVHRWLSTDTYWARGRSVAKVRQAAAESLNFGVYDSTGAQVAYARVVTDETTFAWLCDVYVDPPVRGQGVGSFLIEAVCDHLAPWHLSRVMLATRDAHALYEKAGFVPLANSDQFMALLPPDPTPRRRGEPCR